MMEKIFLFLMCSYFVVDIIIFGIVRNATLAYWERKEPETIHFYTFCPLINIPMAIYFQLKDGDFTGIKSDGVD